MGIEITALQKLLNNIIDVGANFCVLADLQGLSIAFATDKEDPETIETMGAITSLVIPQGEQIASYLGGTFQDTVIHTQSELHRQSILAFGLDTDPKTAIVILCDPELEPQVVHEFQKIKEKIIHSLEGIAVEIRDSEPFMTETSAKKKIIAFWDSLIDSVKKVETIPSLKRTILDAKDNYMQIHGRFSPVLYQMNSYCSRINNNIENFAQFKENTIKQIETWKKHALGIPEKQHEEKKMEKEAEKEIENEEKTSFTIEDLK